MTVIGSTYSSHILDKPLSAEMSAELSAELPAELSAELSPARHQSARDAKGMALKLASRARRTESSTHSGHDARKKAQILASRANRDRQQGQTRLDWASRQGSTQGKGSENLRRELGGRVRRGSWKATAV